MNLDRALFRAYDWHLRFWAWALPFAYINALDSFIWNELLARADFHGGDK